MRTAAGGLRERKKAKTRALIQACALRLFREQGYDATTIEQIAAAAEVSPSTVYHYFPTKPDLVIYDDLDDTLMDAMRAQPPGLSALQTLRAAFRDGFGSLDGEAFALQGDRARLMWTVPEVRAVMLSELARTLRRVMGLLAERLGRAADDETVAALSGAVLGIGIAVWLASEGEAGTEGLVARMDKGLALLESGFRL